MNRKYKTEKDEKKNHKSFETQSIEFKKNIFHTLHGNKVSALNTYVFYSTQRAHEWIFLDT